MPLLLRARGPAATVRCVTWQRRLGVVLVATFIALALLVVVGVVRDWYSGNCWPWKTQQDRAGATLCDGEPHPHSRA